MRGTKRFEVRYVVEDGYCKDRPQYFTIDGNDLEDDMDEGDLRELYSIEVENDFENKISFSARNEDEFVEWAKSVIAERLEKGE